MKKWKYWVAAGIGAIALGVALWPSNDENLETKVEEPVRESKINKVEMRKHFLEISKMIKQPEEVVIEEESELPSCLQCEDWKPKVEHEWYDNGQKKSEIIYACEEFHGTIKTWHRNGNLEFIAEHFCGKPNGIGIGWNEDGNKTAEANFINGKRHGRMKSWYGNGQEKKEFNHVNGILDGKQTEWYENGEYRSIEYYKDGKPQQRSHYYPNGNLRFEAYYTETGSLKEAIYYNKEGKCTERKQGIKTKLKKRSY